MYAMLKTLISAAVIATFTMPSSANATPKGTAGTIAAVASYPSGFFEFSLNGTTQPQLCNNATRVNFVVGLDTTNMLADNMKRMYATIMSAFLSGKTIIVIADDSSTATNGDCTLVSVQINN